MRNRQSFIIRKMRKVEKQAEWEIKKDEKG